MVTTLFSFRSIFTSLAIFFTFFGSISNVTAQESPSKTGLKQAAVLLSEANLEFARKTAWTGGPANYQGEVNELVRILKSQGIDAETITDEQIKEDGLWNYRSLYVIDTFSIDRKTFEKIVYYVKGGGLLVGICEVGRYQGGWASKWPFGELFGLKTKVIDEYGTGVSNDSALYQQANLTEEGKKDPLLKGISGKINFGMSTSNIWVTIPDGAKVLATFPEYLKKVRQSDGSYSDETANEPVPAVTIHRYEKGTTVFIAALANARQTGILEKAVDVTKILKNAQAFAAEQLVKMTPKPPEPVLAFSQAGYLPEQLKQAILVADPALAISEPKFEVFSFPSGTKVAGGGMKAVEKHFWGKNEWVADFTDVKTEGSYWIEANWKEANESKKLTTSVFRIDPILYRLYVIPSQFSFFHEYRCGERCHRNSPLPGGYHDATGDWAVRMWSMPHVVYGLARYLEIDPASVDDAREELRYALDWCLKMQGPNGEVWDSVATASDNSDTKIRPWEETTPRIIRKGDEIGYRLSYTAGLARAAKVLKPIDPALSEKALAAAVKTWNHTQKGASKLSDTGNIGNWIWGNMELFNATRDPKYLEEAKKFAVIQLKRQLRRTDQVVDAPICGDFFDAENRQAFGMHQYKTFTQLGIYAGLIELHQALAPSDPLWWPVHASLERLVHGYFEPMASVTPYGLVGKALERDRLADKFKIFFFDNPRTWDGAHFGFNSDYLAEGLMALDYARQTGQPELIPFAEAQVQWIFGNNPLGYSMVDGIGSRIAPMIDDSIGTGRVFGGIPNGYEGEGKANLPIWDESWAGREYWLPHNSYFLPLIAELQWRRNISKLNIPFSWEVQKTANKYTVTVSDKDFAAHHLELLVEGGTLTPSKPVIEKGKATWTIEPAANEPLVLLLRDSAKPEIYLQKFILVP